MEFDGTVSLDGVSTEEAWLALSDPVMIKNALPGCQYLVRVEAGPVDFDAVGSDDEDPPVLPDADPGTVAARAFEEGSRYAAVMQLGVGNVKPRFETVVTIDSREFPEMVASGDGSASGSSFEMASGMTLVETADGVDVEWWAEADVFGRVAQMGQRVLNPVANRVVTRFFGRVEEQLAAVGEDDAAGLRDRIRELL